MTQLPTNDQASTLENSTLENPAEFTNETLTLTSDFQANTNPHALRLPLTSHSSNALRLLCVTAYEGDPAWLRTIHPHQKAWALRNNVELKIIKKKESAAFSRATIHTCLLRFLRCNADWLLYLSPRVMIHPLAQSPLQEDLALGIWATPLPMQHPRRSLWETWVNQTFTYEVLYNYRYRDGGVWLLDRATAEKWLTYTEEMVLPNVPEEYYFNLWLLRSTADQKINLHALAPEWNRLAEASSSVAWFYHCAGIDPGQELTTLQMAGYLPLARPPVTIKPWPAEPEQENLIAIPYHLETDVWKAEALRFALRSIESYFEPDWPLIVYGTACPEWLNEDVFQLEPSYPQVGLRAFSKARKVLWMSDDILFLKQTSEKILETPVRFSNLVPSLPAMLQQKNLWQRARGHITGRLYHENGVDPVLDFSTHTPGLFHREHARKTFDHFGVWYKFPFELAYHGLLGSAGRPCDDKADFQSRDDSKMRWLNLDDQWVDNPEFRTWMRVKFPNPSKWER